MGVHRSFLVLLVCTSARTFFPPPSASSMRTDVMSNFLTRVGVVFWFNLQGSNQHPAANQGSTTPCFKHVPALHLSPSWRAPRPFCMRLLAGANRDNLPHPALVMWHFEMGLGSCPCVPHAGWLPGKGSSRPPTRGLGLFAALLVAARSGALPSLACR